MKHGHGRSFGHAQTQLFQRRLRKGYSAMFPGNAVLGPWRFNADARADGAVGANTSGQSTATDEEGICSDSQDRQDL